MATTNVNAAATANTLAQAALSSPYNGTSAIPGLGGYPIEAGYQPGSLAGLTGGRPQVNATNQSALAPNGDINQTVTNSNHYDNKYYSIVTSPAYGVGGGSWGGWGNSGANWNSPYGSNSFVDPQTGVMYVRQETGILGWFKRLLRGY